MITHITQSIINQIGRCPVQFEFRYINNIIIPPGFAARKGSAVHFGAETAHRFRVNNDNEAPPLELIADSTRDEFVRLVNDEGIFMTKEELFEGKNKILGNAQDEAIRGASAYVNKCLPYICDIAMFEERLYADIGLELPVSGKPDLVADSMNNDIKTNNGARWREEDVRLECQPTLYRMLLRENGFGELNSRYTVITNMNKAPDTNIHEGTLWDEENRTCIDELNTERTAEDEKKLIFKIDTYIKMINSGIFIPCRQGKGNWACTPKYCGFYKMCKYT